MEDTLNKLIHNNTVDYPIYIDFHLPTRDLKCWYKIINLKYNFLCKIGKIYTAVVNNPIFIEG